MPTSSAARKLLALVPPTARVIRDGQEEEVPNEQIRLGDLARCTAVRRKGGSGRLGVL
ncbi:MAG: hypothetical protein HYY04_07735 [Chloroflexi bacterium]|nr:hypothetical protein [Chloroflexota bacterium]